MGGPTKKDFRFAREKYRANSNNSNKKNKKQKICWICGRTNRDIREEIDGLSNNSSMISPAGGINGTQLYCCYACVLILRDVTNTCNLKHFKILEKTLEKDINDTFSKIDKKLEKFFTIKKLDEFKDVS
jgi:hypothetical protein